MDFYKFTKLFFAICTLTSILFANIKKNQFVRKIPAEVEGLLNLSVAAGQVIHEDFFEWHDAFVETVADFGEIQVDSLK